MRYRITEILEYGTRPLYIQTAACQTARKAAQRRRDAYEPNTGERAMLLALWNHRCAYCGSVLGRGLRTLTLDHLLPVARGGRTTLENVSVACLPCNNRKGNQTALEFNRPDVAEAARRVALAVDEFWMGYSGDIPAQYRTVLMRMVSSRLLGARRLR